MQGIEITKQESTIAKQPDGELTPAGDFVVKKEELPNGYKETHREGLVKIRGEKEPRRINYADYTKLATFYANQARLVKDRKHIMVHLSNGIMINTADITSLETEDCEHFIPKLPQIPDQLKDLPTQSIMITIDGEIINEMPTRFTERCQTKEYLIADCHFKQNPDGSKKFFTDLAQIPHAMRMRPGEYNSTIIQTYKYGIPQL